MSDEITYICDYCHKAVGTSRDELDLHARTHMVIPDKDEP